MRFLARVLDASGRKGGGGGGRGESGRENFGFIFGKRGLGSNGVRRVLDPSATYSIFPGW